MKTNPINTSRTFHVKFNKPEFNATYIFERHESHGFDYGNKSGVTILKNGKFYAAYDTRYDKLVMKDFDAWCGRMLNNMFDPEYEPEWEEVEA